MPTISICLPNLNNCGYLPELLDSIFAQTFEDWRLIVVDNYSDDGAWELLRERAAGEPRMSISQAPREGMYANWNNCIRLADGDYIYIATSDDKLAPDCLEKLSAALERHPDCGIAHCPPFMFGENAEQQQNWWRHDSPLAISTAGRLDRSHVRRAPHDGFLHASGHSVIISITQMLIRREVFQRVGLFPNDVGVVGDFEWQVRAAFFVNNVYVPDTWGGWRLHPAQATARNTATLAEQTRLLLMLFERALDCFLASPEGQRYQAVGEKMRRLVRLRSAYVAQWEAPRPVWQCALRLGGAAWRGGALGDLLRLGFRGARSAIRSPARFWAENAERECGLRIEWI